MYFAISLLSVASWVIVIGPIKLCLICFEIHHEQILGEIMFIFYGLVAREQLK